MMRTELVFTLLVSLSLTAVQVSSLVNEEDSVARFREYLRINTAHPNPDYSTVAHHIQNLGIEIGLETQILPIVANKPIVLLTWRGTDPSLPSIQLSSHVDVVPAESEKWEHDPFHAFKDASGNIFARGSQDMKCVGAQYLEAIRVLKSSGFKPIRSIHVTFVPDEEIGGKDGVGAFVESEHFKKLNVGLLLDEGLASPSSKYRIFYAERSPWWLVIKATGQPGHGSKHYDNSASENLLKSLNAIQQFRSSQFDLVKAGLKQEGEVISVNTVFLKSGSPTPTGFVMNLQPSEASAGFDIRLHPLADTASLERRIAEEWAPTSRNMSHFLVQKVSPTDKWGKPAVTPVDDSNPWWPVFKRAVENGAGAQLEAPEIFLAATDARYHRQLGIPAFGFSPMSNTPVLLHDHNEFLNEAEFLKGIKVYVEVIKALSSVEFPKRTKHVEL